MCMGRCPRHNVSRSACRLQAMQQFADAVLARVTILADALAPVVRELLLLARKMHQVLAGRTSLTLASEKACFSAA